MMSVRRMFVLITVTAGCTAQQPGTGGRGNDSAAVAAAIAASNQRMQDHGEAGLSLSEVKRTRDWYTPQLYALLVHDMSDPAGVGYLEWGPFTNAQDNVGAFHLEGARSVGDTVMVRYSFQLNPQGVTLAMLRVDGVWRIANIVFPGNSPCNRDLAVGLTRFAKNAADGMPHDAGGCND